MIRVVFFIMMAFGLAGFGTVAWIATRQSASQAAVVQPARLVVLAAAHPIGAGSLLKPDDFAPKTVLVEPGKEDSYAIDTPELRRDLMGAMTKRAVAAGDVLRETDVIRPGDHGFLAAALQPGMNAVTITVDTGTGAGELIGPGDRIDLILTQSLADASIPAGRRVAAETVLSDVRVLAIDQKLVLGAAATPDHGSNRTVTLEVSEGQAERISVASQLGHLSLSVRSAGLVPAAAPVPGSAPVPKREGGTVWAVDVSPALGATAKTAAPATGLVRVFQGAGDVKEFKVDAPVIQAQ